MADISSLLSDTSRKLLAQSSILRSLVRKLDAPFLHKVLNESAQLLEDAQRELTKSEDEAERAYLMLENIIHNGVQLPPGMHTWLKRYRDKHPRKAFNEWNQPLQK